MLLLLSPCRYLASWKNLVQTSRHPNVRAMGLEIGKKSDIFLASAFKTDAFSIKPLY
jgi:hypothetical protein